MSDKLKDIIHRLVVENFRLADELVMANEKNDRLKAALDGANKEITQLRGRVKSLTVGAIGEPEVFTIDEMFGNFTGADLEKIFDDPKLAGRQFYTVDEILERLARP